MADFFEGRPLLLVCARVQGKAAPSQLTASPRTLTAPCDARDAPAPFLSRSGALSFRS